MSTKTYDCYVRLAYANLDERLVPVTQVHRANDPQFPGGWHDLVTDNTIAVWLVERTSVTHAQDLLLAHLAGHAPVGTTLLYEVGKYQADG
jgi:hypothetical protein